MKINANPFHPQTGKLLAGYRDAYLRGDLTDERAAQVEQYLKRNAADGDAVLLRFAHLRLKGHSVKPAAWVRQQFTQLQRQPQLLRQRMAGFACVGLLVSGVIMAGTNLPETVTIDRLPTEDALANSAGSELEVAVSSVRLVSGRIFNEHGQPLAGATVLDKVSGRGVSTNAEGNYQLLLPQGSDIRLQYGYAGYQEQEYSQEPTGKKWVTLLPREAPVHTSRVARLWHKLVR